MFAEQSKKWTRTGMTNLLRSTNFFPVDNLLPQKSRAEENHRIIGWKRPLRSSSLRAETKILSSAGGKNPVQKMGKKG